ncbi:MAG: hypothetical protein ACRDRL_30600 [Sciscionella sp.]
MLHRSGLTLVIVTHDAKIAAGADRVVAMRDGSFANETRSSGSSMDDLGSLSVNDGSRLGTMSQSAARPR